MADEHTSLKVGKPPERSRPEQVTQRQEEQQPQAAATARKDRRRAPGRSPLFRN